MKTWASEDGVALREFFSKVPQDKVSEVMKPFCPAEITAEMILTNNADAVARLAAMKAGWEAYEKNLFALAIPKPDKTPDPGFRDMS